MSAIVEFEWNSCEIFLKKHFHCKNYVYFKKFKVFFFFIITIVCTLFLYRHCMFFKQSLFAFLCKMFSTLIHFALVQRLFESPEFEQSFQTNLWGLFKDKILVFQDTHCTYKHSCCRSHILVYTVMRLNQKPVHVKQGDAIKINFVLCPQPKWAVWGQNSKLIKIYGNNNSEFWNL